MKDLQKDALLQSTTNTNDINIDVDWNELPDTPYGTIGTIPFHDTTGQIDVNGGGQLQYTLPIALPPGIKSVAPQINLNYVSGSGNGIAGYGWNLSGITSISRMGRTIEKDGEIKGIQLGYSDFYQFNGQRLILVSGEYGKDGAEYTTEKYSNVKIKSIGVNETQTGPFRFEVTFEDGSQAWYGDEPFDLRPIDQDPMARTPTEYNIVKWKDAQGNYISYRYLQDIGGSKNITAISRIYWGGNEDVGTSSFNSIIFDYKYRDLPENSYINGKKFIQGGILSNIEVHTNGSLFKKYNIEYTGYNDKNRYQFIKSITESNSKGEKAAPVNFNYETDPLTHHSRWDDSRFDDIYKSNIVSGDFTGNGKMDFLGGKSLMLDRLDGPGKVINVSYEGDALTSGMATTPDNVLLSKQALFTQEINIRNKSLTIRAYELANESLQNIGQRKYDLMDYPRLFFGHIFGDGSTKYYRHVVQVKEGDFDGDGISEFILYIFNLERDILTLKNERIYEQRAFYLNFERNMLKEITHSDFFAATIGETIENLEIPSYPGNFIETGKTDLLTVTKNVFNIYKLDKYYNFYKVFSENKTSEIKRVLLGDFTGDGKTDIFIPMAEESSDWEMYIATGNGFIKHDYPNFIFYQPSWTPNSNRRTDVKRSYFTPDLNKDGKSDFLMFYSETWSHEPDYKNRDAKYGIYYYKNNGVDANGKPIFTIGYLLDPDDWSQGNFSDYGEHYIPLVGSFRIAQANSELSIIHKTEFITWDFGDKLNVISRIKEIEQGGIKTEIKYTPATKENGFYQSGVPMQYPFVNIGESYSQYFVSQLIQEHKKQDFKYRNLIGHLQGKGMIGFRQSARSSWYADGYENTKIWSGAEIDPLQEGLPIKEWSVKTIDDDSLIFPNDISLSNTQLLSFKSTDYEITTPSTGVKAIVAKKTITKDFLKDITQEISVIYGNYYLPKETTTKVNNDIGVTSTVMNYIHNPNGVGKDYFIGRPESKIETVTAYGDTKSAKEEYTYENNLLKTLKTYNRDNSGWIQEKYKYDGFGNIVEKSTTNSVDTMTQTEKSQYEAKGRSVAKKTDNLGLETYVEYNDWGQTTKITEPLGAITENKYDGWGKLEISRSNLNGTSTSTYERLEDGSRKVTQYAPDGIPKDTYTNKLGQQYSVRSRGFNRTYINEDMEVTVGDTYTYINTRYDMLGRKISETESYLNNEEPKWNNINYDDSVFPAVVTTTAFNGKTIKTTISGRTIILEELNGYKRITNKTTDALGNVVSSEDKGGIINFTFNAAGEQLTAQYGSNVVTTKYDVWGRKSEFYDPSNGLYKYEYNGFGQIKKEVSPRGYKEYFYNDKGQLVDETEKSNIVGLTDKSISVSYNDKGLLTEKIGVSNGKNYSTTIIYDTFGRLLERTEKSNGRTYVQKNIVYDNLSRLVSYEKGVTSGGVYTKTMIENVYDNWSGWMYQIKDKLSGTILWRLYESNGSGQALRSRFGASDITNTYDYNNFLSQTEHRSTKGLLFGSRYTFDAVKNELKERFRQGNFALDEIFTYDDNNRLVEWTNPKTGGVSSNKYDIKGRIVENDQLGVIQFGNTNKVYQPTGAKLSAIGKQNYLNAEIQRVIYNENNDPLYIQSKKGDVRFEYGLTNMRQLVTYGQAAPVGNNGTIEDFATSDWEGEFTKYYSEDGSIEVVHNNTTGEEKHILYIGGTPYESNILYLKDFTQSNGSYKFLHKDYLGSILAISDEEGNLVQETHFDAWGRLAAGGTNLLDRGYTSHEHFEDIGIIHMNGRLYDPLLRRFLNADENIQDPYNTQVYNKYAYVINNPLIYNDPSGEIFGIDDLIISAIIIGAMISAGTYAIQAFLAGSWNWLDFARSLFVGIFTSAATAGIGPIFSASGFWAAVGNGAILGAISGGVTATMNGTNFIQGVLTGAIMGGIIGGITWGVNKLFNDPNGNQIISEVKESELPSANNGTSVEQSSKSVRDIMNTEFKGKVPGKGSIRVLHKPSDLPGYMAKEGYKFDGKVLTNGDGEKVAATTGNFYNNKYFRYVFAPYAFRSAETLTLATGHELIHANLHYYGIPPSTVVVPSMGLSDTPDTDLHHLFIAPWERSYINLRGWNIVAPTELYDLNKLLILPQNQYINKYIDRINNIINKFLK
ncbi:RHS repeat-associated core domain-containing protein [Elizabethkingia anophelis]|uniref:RHS repeat-associated core domain-containing protein n=1 Tax=Elizabethkingia anophelis TaxID=1117645 RepID=UPI0038921E1F